MHIDSGNADPEQPRTAHRADQASYIQHGLSYWLKRDCHACHGRQLLIDSTERRIEATVT